MLVTIGIVRMLVVDDEPAVRESLASSLAFEDYEIDTAVDGLDALDKLDRVKPDLILIDILMPAWTG